MNFIKRTQAKITYNPLKQERVFSKPLTFEKSVTNNKTTQKLEESHKQLPNMSLPQTIVGTPEGKEKERVDQRNNASIILSSNKSFKRNITKIQVNNKISETIDCIVSADGCECGAINEDTLAIKFCFGPK